MGLAVRPAHHCDLRFERPGKDARDPGPTPRKAAAHVILPIIGQGVIGIGFGSTLSGMRWRAPAKRSAISTHLALELQRWAAT
jgi:hypothetical protein